MQFTILCYETAADFAKRNSAEAPVYWGAWSAYGATLAQAGVLVSGAGLLAPDMASTVRLRADRRDVQDGPYAETREQLGGFYIIDCAGMDEAVAWAKRCPAAQWGPIEVRAMRAGFAAQ